MTATSTVHPEPVERLRQAQPERCGVTKEGNINHCQPGAIDQAVGRKAGAKPAQLETLQLGSPLVGLCSGSLVATLLGQHGQCAPGLAVQARILQGHGGA